MSGAAAVSPTAGTVQMAVIVALLGAAAYGLSDFLGGVTARRVSPWSVALVGQLGGAVSALLAALVVAGSPTSADLAWAALAGLGSGLGTSFLYRGLAGGRMGVVAPVSGVGAAVVPVLVGVGQGERPGPLVAAGILVALPGIFLVAREPAAAPEPAETTQGQAGPSGLGDGIAAGIGFGVLFVALAQLGHHSGLLPLALDQAVGAGTVVAVAGGLRVAWVPRTPRVLVGAASGALAVVATVGFLVASRTAYLSVAGVLLSLYPAFTVLLAAGVLHERIHRVQAGGLALCAGAVALVALG